MGREEEKGREREREREGRGGEGREERDGKESAKYIITTTNTTLTYI